MLIIAFIFSLSLTAQDFDPVNPDYDLLKQLVLEKIDQKRSKKTTAPLINNAALQTTADNYTAILRASKLEKNSENKAKINKKFKRNCKSNGYQYAFVDYHIMSVPCMNARNSAFYFDKEDTETTTHLFAGKKPTKKEKAEEGFQARPIKLYTYQALADIIVSQFVTDEGTFKILNNGFDKFGFSLAVEKRTLFRKRIPALKAIVIVGGKRITW